MKNSNKVLLSTLLGVGLTGAVMTTAHADETKTYTSHGKIELIKNDGSTDPTDPSNPGGTTDPSNPGGTTDPTDPTDPGTGGPLSIDYISNFNFGQQEMSGDDKTYNADLVEATTSTPVAGTKETLANYLQVSDNRGTVTGWKLSVQQKAAFTSETSKQALNGTTITLTNPEVANADGNAAKPAPATLTKSVAISAGTNDQLVMQAADGQGAGTWTESFSNAKTDAAKAKSSVQLTIPGDSKKVAEKYSTDLTWTLTDAGL